TRGALCGRAMGDVVRSSLDSADDAGLPLLHDFGVEVDANIHPRWTLQPHHGTTAQEGLNVRGVGWHTIDDGLIDASTVFSTRVTHGDHSLCLRQCARSSLAM